jgi:hypothetical protein
MNRKPIAMRDNPDQPAVDAELAKFDAQWDKDHGKRKAIDLDAHGPQYGEGGDTEATPQLNTLSMSEWRRQLREKNEARREFIRTNPIIQAALAREQGRKVEEIKSNAAAAVVLAGAVRAAGGFKHANV